MPLRLRLMLLALGSLGTAPMIHAQIVSSIDLGMSNARTNLPRTSPGLTVAPAFYLDRPLASFSALANIANESGTRWHSEGMVAGTLFSPTRAGLRLEVGGEVGSATGSPVDAMRYVRAESRLSVRREANGGWIGGVAGQAWRDVTMPRYARLDLGGWTRVGPAVMTASLSSTHFYANGYTGANRLGDGMAALPTTRIGGVDSGRTGNGSSAYNVVSRDYSDLETGLHWMRGVLAADVALGTRLRGDAAGSTVWGNAEGSFSLSRQLALVVGGGTRPADPARGRIAGNYATVAMRLTSMSFHRRTLPPGVRADATDFGVREVDGGRRTIFVRAATARVVELMGDFTDWEPVAMRRTVGDRWEVTLPIAPGAHRVNVRIDGEEWIAPPGASTVKDEFNGIVGVLVVP